GFRKIHRLRNRTTEEWLAGGHHAQMAHVMETALSLKRLESAIKHRQMLWFQPTLDCSARLRNRDILNRVVFVDVGQDLLDFFVRVPELFQGWFDSLVDDLEHSAACKQLVFYERNIRLNPRCVAIHQEPDRAGRRQHGNLSIPITLFLT